MEAVMPDGKILDLMQKNRKDNTGFDLKQLLIASEGTLGVITKINMLCPPRELNRTVLFLRVNSFEEILKLEVISK